jgi:hypothetical protein
VEAQCPILETALFMTGSRSPVPFWMVGLDGFCGLLANGSLYRSDCWIDMCSPAKVAIPSSLTSDKINTLHPLVDDIEGCEVLVLAALRGRSGAFCNRRGIDLVSESRIVCALWQKSPFHRLRNQLHHQYFTSSCGRFRN